MNDSDAKKLFVLQTAATFFRQRGIQIVTMDDVAKKCGISKKTLYTLFSSKHELVSEILKRDSEIFNQNIKIVKNAAPNAIIEYFSFFQYLKDYKIGVSPAFLYDLKRMISNHPIITNYYDVEKFILENFYRGRKENLYERKTEVKKQTKTISKVLKLILCNGEKINPSGNDDIEVIAQLFCHSIISKRGNDFLKSRICMQNDVCPKIFPYH